MDAEDGEMLGTEDIHDEEQADGETPGPSNHQETQSEPAAVENNMAGRAISLVDIVDDADINKDAAFLEKIGLAFEFETSVQFEGLRNALKVKYENARRVDYYSGVNYY